MQRPSSAQALYVSSSMVLLALIGLHWAQPPTAIAQIDLAPPYDAANMLGKCASAWNHVHAFIGSVDNCFSWTPHYALQALLQLALGTSYGQAAIFILPLMIAWLGAFQCARCLGASPFAAFVAAWVYAFNPAQQSMIGVFATGEVCAALLPWVFSLVMLAALEPARRRFAAAMLATVSFAFVVILAITPQLLVALVLGTIVWIAFASTLAPNRGAFLAWTGKTALLVIAASLWWIVPNAMSYIGVAITHTADPMSVAWTFARASLLNELRFAPMWFWQYPEYNPWSVEFDRNALFYAAGFVPAAGLAGALIVARGRAAGVAGFLAIFALVMLFIAKGTHPPLTWLNLAFYRIPGMFLFIEPYGAILIAALCMALACGIVADRIAARADKRRATTAAIAAGVVFVGASLCANLAAVTGAIFHEQQDPLPNVHIVLPDYWRTLASRLNGEAAPGGVAILPADDFYQVDYDWGFHGADLLPVTLLHRAVLMPGSPLTYTQTPESHVVDAQIVRAIAAGSPAAVTLLRDVGVRYVVVRNDVRLSHAPAPSPGDYAPIFGAPAAVFGPLDLFDLGPVRDGAWVVAQAALAEATHLPPADEIAPAHTVNQTQSRAAASDATPVPAVVSRVRVTSTSLAIDVVNPGSSSMVCDILVGVWPRAATTYTLQTDDGQSRAVTVSSTEAPQWARFAGVRLLSGTTHITVSAPPTIDRRLAAFMPPRFVVDARQQPHVDQIEFANVAMGGSAPGSGATSRAWSPSIGFALNASAVDEPAITVHPKVGGLLGSTDWALDIAVRGATYRCYVHIDDETRLDLDDALRACLRGEGRMLTAADQGRSIVTGLWMLQRDAGGPIASATIDSMPPNAAPATSATEALRDRPLASAPLPLGLGSVISVVGQASLAHASVVGQASLAHASVVGQASLAHASVLGQASLAHGVSVAHPTTSAINNNVVGQASLAHGEEDITTSEAYSPTWVAWESGQGFSFLPHREALVWRNVWRVSAPGAVYVVNWLVLAQEVLVLVGLLIVILAWRRR
jgi:hypothetical protein